MVETARAVVDAGADAVVVGNALPAAHARRSGRVASAARRSGRSRLRCVAEVARALPETPVIGCGGIMDADDARAYLAAGARAVQVGTALFHDPTTAFRIAQELDEADGTTCWERTTDDHLRSHGSTPPCTTAARSAPGSTPTPRCCAAWGLDDDLAGLERFALTAAEALAPRVAVVKPQSAFYERFGSRGIAVLERLIADVPRRRRAGAPRREAR